MVFGIRLFSIINCAGHTKPKTFLPEQTVEIFVCGDCLNDCLDADFTFHSTWSDFWVYPTANFIPSARRDNCDGLHHFGGIREDDVLQEGEMLNGAVYNQFFSNISIALSTSAVSD